MLDERPYFHPTYIKDHMLCVGHMTLYFLDEVNVLYNF